MTAPTPEPDLGDVISAAQEYGDQRAAAEKARGDAALAALQTEFDAYKAAHPETPPDPDPEPTTLTSIGMSSPKALWDQRLREVGADGITSMRIYCDLSASGLDNRDRIEWAIANDITPVVSFKPADRDYGASGRGAHDTDVYEAAAYLDSLGGTVLVASWHEPSDDMTAAEYMAFQRRHLPILNERPNLRTFNINHGWLLDRQTAKFADYLPAELVDLVDYAGIDTYQSGTEGNPGPREPHHRIAALVDYLASIDRPDKPVIVGEWNAYTAAAVARAGEAILSTPNVAYALVFNSQQGGKGLPLTGERLAAFRAIKGDPRVQQ